MAQAEATTNQMRKDWVKGRDSFAKSAPIETAGLLANPDPLLNANPE